MNKKKFCYMTVVMAAAAIVAYIFNIPEMVDGQGGTAPIAFSVLFLAAATVYALECRSKKGILIAGTIYWVLSAAVAAAVMIAVLSSADSSVLIIPAFFFSAGYFAVAALFGAPGAGYLAALLAIPAAELVYHIALLCKAKKQ